MLGTLDHMPSQAGESSLLGPSEDFGESSIRLQLKPQSFFTSYWIDIGLKTSSQEGSVSFLFTDYPERKAEREKAMEGKESPLYLPIKFELTQEQAKQLPELKQMVQIKANMVTFVQVLRLLHKNYGILYVSDPLYIGYIPEIITETDRPKLVMPRADVDLGPMPLGEALDRLTEIYKDTEWEWRPMGFLVVRGERSPSRTRSKGSVSKTYTFPIKPPAP